MRRRDLVALGGLVTLTLIVLLPLVGHVAIAASSPPYAWSGPVQVDTGSNLDILPSALQASNGSIWLAWQSFRFSTTGRPDILYKVSNGNWGSSGSGVWGSTGRITSSNINTSPSLAQLGNGTVFLFWAGSPSTTPNHFNIYYERCCTFNPQTGTYQWSSTVHLTTSLLNDTSPYSTVGSDGRLWLFWSRSNFTSSNTQIYSRTLVNSVWSGDAQLTSDTANQNVQPSAMVGKDGALRLVFSKGAPSTGVYQIYNMTYNGVVWTSPTQQPNTGFSSSNSDEHASIMQDRNGTIWLFWGRLLGVGGTNPYYVLESQFSINNGKSWSTAAQIGSEASGIDDKQPNAVQATSSTDKSIHILISSDRTNNNYDIWGYSSPSIYPVHDVKISFLSVSSSLQYAGGMASVGQSANITVNFTVQNVGDTLENVRATVTVSNTTSISLGTQTVQIPLGSAGTFIFNWNTTNAIPARYIVNASVTETTASETVGNSVDNNLVMKNAVHVIPWGDVDQDGAVTLTDVSVFFYNFNFTPATPSRWNPFCDINNNGIIDINDEGVAVKNFGTNSN